MKLFRFGGGLLRSVYREIRVASSLNSVHNIECRCFRNSSFLSTLAQDGDSEDYNWDPKKEDASKHSEKFECRPSFDNSELNSLQLQLLNTALTYVDKHGWTSDTLVAAANELKLSPALVGSFNNREDVQLVLHFLNVKMVDLENFLIDLKSDHVEKHGKVKINSFVFEACKQMFLYIVPILHHWPAALSILADPRNAFDTVKHHAEMVDLIWNYAGDTSLDYNWYSKRILLSAVINSTQLFLLQDKSNDHEDTWMFLENRLKDIGSIGSSIHSVRQSLHSINTVADVAVETARNILGVPVIRR